MHYCRWCSQLTPRWCKAFTPSVSGFKDVFGDTGGLTEDGREESEGKQKQKDSAHTLFFLRFIKRCEENALFFLSLSHYHHSVVWSCVVCSDIRPFPVQPGSLFGPGVFG